MTGQDHDNYRRRPPLDLATLGMIAGFCSLVVGLVLRHWLVSSASHSGDLGAITFASVAVTLGLLVGGASLFLRGIVLEAEHVAIRVVFLAGGLLFIALAAA